MAVIDPEARHHVVPLPVERLEEAIDVFVGPVQPSTLEKSAGLRLLVLHSQESIEAHPFDSHGSPIVREFDLLTHLMRDRKTGEERRIDPRLVTLLMAIAARYHGKTLHLVSGYRAPGHGTRDSSYHTRGMAADIRIPGVSPTELCELAGQLGARGVGLYPEERFVHVDVRLSPYRWQEVEPGLNNAMPKVTGCHPNLLSRTATQTGEDHEDHEEGDTDVPEDSIASIATL